MKMLLGVLMSIGLTSSVLLAQVAAPQQQQQPQQQQEGQLNGVPVPEKDIQGSIDAANAWLQLVDSGNYGASWDTGALTFQFTISRSEWIKAMQKLRQPLGTVTSRQLEKQLVANNPKGLPAGEYMVLYYKTVFSNRPEANELITEQQQNNGTWKVLTYQAR